MRLKHSVPEGWTPLLSPRPVRCPLPSLPSLGSPRPHVSIPEAPHAWFGSCLTLPEITFPNSSSSPLFMESYTHSLRFSLIISFSPKALLDISRASDPFFCHPLCPNIHFSSLRQTQSFCCFCFTCVFVACLLHIFGPLLQWALPWQRLSSFLPWWCLPSVMLSQCGRPCTHTHNLLLSPQ